MQGWAVSHLRPIKRPLHSHVYRLPSFALSMHRALFKHGELSQALMKVSHVVPVLPFSQLHLKPLPFGTHSDLPSHRLLVQALLN